LDRAKVLLYAASTRIVLGLVALVLLPGLYPRMAAHRWLFAAYFASALFFQVLIWKRIGGDTRSTVAGIVDLLILTFIVQRVGSIATMLVSVYFFAAIMNTLIVGHRVGLALAAVASLLYCGVLGAEAVGLLPYGPDAPYWASRPPQPGEAFLSGAIVTVLLLASTGVVGMLVHTIRLRERELSELSQRDPLTQLYNRRHLLARIEEELARVKRGKSLAVVMIDLDRFKRVNDAYGHLRGDALLRELADALAATTRATDVAGRYGGDEFVVVLPDTTREQASAAADRIVEAVRVAGVVWDPELPVTASVGVSVAGPDDSALSLLRRADDLAYRAKEAGGSRALVPEA
jgi:diguanylate cyclase (GGDEF)-like protein